MTSARTFPLLLLCFFLSGAAALAYETAWTREFAFVFGTSELAVAMVLAAYMGGLALGAAVASRLVGRIRRPVRVYGFLELGIAVAALCVPYAIAASRRLYVALFAGGEGLSDAGSGLGTSLFYAGFSLLILLIPTSMMGATLPLLARHAVSETRQIGPRIGLLYGVNTAGAVLGALLTAFVLLPSLGLRSTIAAAAGLNLCIFLAAWALSRSAPLVPATLAPEPRSAARAGPALHWILPVSLVSGAVSFGYEVIWVRLLVHLLGGSIQAFATMLGSFLTGIALGSALAARLASSPRRAAAGYALAQLGTALLAWLAFRFADEIPELSRSLATSGLPTDAVRIVVSMLALLPAALCIGMTFPFAVRLLTSDPTAAGTASGRVYSWNTVGSIVGSLGTAFLLLPALGFAKAIAACAIANLVLAGSVAWLGEPRRPRLLGAAALAAILLFVVPPATPWKMLTATSLGASNAASVGRIEYFDVGRSASVLLEDQGTIWQLRSNGLPEAGMTMPEAWPNAFPLTRWLTALPVLARPETRRMLVIGLGGGTALEIVPSSVERIDVVELEPKIVEANRRIRTQRWRDPLADPRVRIHVNDARNALLLADPSRTRFDAIVSQPSHPWSGGAAHLYTEEFFALAESRLAPGGVFLQWIGTGFLDEALMRSLLASLTRVFDHVEVYAPPPGVSLLFLCSNEPFDLARSAERALSDSPEDFELLGLHVPGEILSTLRLDAEGARALAEGAPPNRDEHNRVQARAERLGRTSITHRSAFLDAYDPLTRLVAERDDGLFLLRQLIPFEKERLARISRQLSQEADRKTALALLEIAEGKPRSAARSLREVLDGSPQHVEARAALLGLSAAEIARGQPLSEILDPPFREAEELVAGAWRQARGKAGDTDAGRADREIAERDALLAAVDRTDPLWKEAIRLRIRARLDRGGARALAEAMQLADASLGPHPDAAELLMRARVQAALGRSAAALDALVHVGRRLDWADPRSRAYAQEATRIIREIPANAELAVLRAAAERSIARPGA